MRLMQAIVAQKSLKNWLAERDHGPVHGHGDDKLHFLRYCTVVETSQSFNVVLFRCKERGMESLCCMYIAATLRACNFSCAHTNLRICSLLTLAVIDMHWQESHATHR